METLMDEVLDSIHNYFPVSVHEGTYTVNTGISADDILQTGQYFRVRGSVFNDGVWEYPATQMKAETFTGEIWALAVPLALISLIDEIAAWNAQYGGNSSAAMSPFTSESFNNYSYSKGAVTNADGSYAPVTWRNAFASRLDRWRKLP